MRVHKNADKNTRSRFGSSRHYRREADTRLKKFRNGSRLAVAITAMFLLFNDAFSQNQSSGNVNSVEEVASTVKQLVDAFYALLPKMTMTLIVCLLGWTASKVVKRVLRSSLANSQKGRSVVALSQLGVGFVTIIIAVSIMVGDVRALLGSLGLLGLALSWALQAPIESFSGWVLNMFRSYYRPGDRIEVGTVLGDVYRIDILTTTVWEIGGPGKSVQGSQPTGALTTFPNSEILKSNIINYTRDFDYVWDEIVVGIANESDIPYSIGVIRAVATRVLGNDMKVAAKRYTQLLTQARLEGDVEDTPQIYLSATESYINFTIRYLAPIRSKRKISSELLEAVLLELDQPQHKGKIIGSLPVQQIFLIKDSGNEKRISSLQ